jgi:hypothetical protein
MRGKQSFDPPRIELNVRKGAARGLIDDDSANQVAGDDEENIDADIAAAEAEEQFEVIENNGEHCNGAQAVDIRSIGHVPTFPLFL